MGCVYERRRRARIAGTTRTKRTTTKAAAEATRGVCLQT